jgi:hypothetical protein
VLESGDAVLVAAAGNDDPSQNALFATFSSLPNPISGEVEYSFRSEEQRRGER